MRAIIGAVLLAAMVAGETTAQSRSDGSGSDSVSLTQADIAALIDRISQCWRPPIGATPDDDLIVRIYVAFNIDGTVASGPDVLERPAARYGPAAAENARQAILGCAPYGDVLPPEKYEAWREMLITFDPNIFGWV